MTYIGWSKGIQLMCHCINYVLKVSLIVGRIRVCVLRGMCEYISICILSVCTYVYSNWEYTTYI